MIFQVKKYSQKLLLPLGRKLSNIPANIFTILSLVFSIISGLGFYLEVLPLIIICLFLIEFFDQLDGVIARLQGPTKFGAFLDSTLDRYGDAAIFIGIILGSYITPILGLIAFIGAFLTSYTRARIEGLQDKSLGGIGLLERTDRVPLLMIGAIFQIFYAEAIWWIIIIMIIGSHITVLQRMIYAYKNLSRKQEEKVII
ncbi:CDP-alcohol phosphatidyltransferase family protein [Promethearchaeum syntrophicum]|uniref:CDP-alcohol phosphatidyltransferase family protein n=1 Tax=Promethearchaeum syntrophicum TaxID=2594042 RepID=A0A5B9DBQ1_9ARCH|nr:CDP-alcohol phosphatidyltransferase family protein [Candidatus Prometheoarchaeum syntrophicum]QEE16574.1 Archaetidylinositol phosphate synthase [Candidatus Prometheoarchaeum syntrophicum]